MDGTTASPSLAVTLTKHCLLAPSTPLLQRHVVRMRWAFLSFALPLSADREWPSLNDIIPASCYLWRGVNEEYDHVSCSSVPVRWQDRAWLYHCRCVIVLQQLDRCVRYWRGRTHWRMVHGRHNWHVVNPLSLSLGWHGSEGFRHFLHITPRYPLKKIG